MSPKVLFDALVRLVKASWYKRPPPRSCGSLSRSTSFETWASGWMRGAAASMDLDQPGEISMLNVTTAMGSPRAAGPFRERLSRLWSPRPHEVDHPHAGDFHGLIDLFEQLV